MSDTRSAPTVVSEHLQSSVSTTGHTRTDTASVFAGEPSSCEYRSSYPVLLAVRERTTYIAIVAFQTHAGGI